VCIFQSMTCNTSKTPTPT